MPRITGNVRNRIGGPVAYRLKGGRRLRKYKPRRAKHTATFAKKVMAIVNRQMEHKYVAEYMLDSSSTGYVNFNSPINTSSDWYRCIPLLPESTSQANSYTRQGKEITPTHLNCNWTFHFSQVDDHSRDIYVVLYVLQSIQFKKYATISINGQLTTSSDYLDQGNGTDTAFTGKVTDYQAPIERDKYRLLHKKRFRLAKSSGDSNGTGVIGQYDGHGEGLYATNGPKMITHTWKCPLPKKLKYDETGGVTSIPTNSSPVWGVGYYYADGTSPDTGGGILAVDFWAGLHFLDD